MQSQHGQGEMGSQRQKGQMARGLEVQDTKPGFHSKCKEGLCVGCWGDEADGDTV